MRMVLAIAVLGGACGGGGDSGEAFLGVYTVTAHHDARNQGGSVSCDAAGDPVAGGDPLIALVEDPFFGMDPDFLVLQTCTAPDACTDTIHSFNPGGPGLETLSANTQTGGGTDCNLYAGRDDATLTGDVLHLSLQSWFDAPPGVSGDDCSLARAKALRDSPDCLEVETYDATRMP